MGMLASVGWVALAAAAAWACGGSDSGLSRAPEARFSEIACLDLNGDDHLDGADAAAPARLPDITGDGAVDSDDAARLAGLDIALDPARDDASCDGAEAPEYLVASGGAAQVGADCAQGPALLVMAIGGGVVNLKHEDDAAGVRAIANALLGALEPGGTQVEVTVSGPIVIGALNPHSAMESWLTQDLLLRLQAAPCLRAVLIGHSHGAVVAEVVASRLEQEFGSRMFVVAVDRVAELYTGDTASRAAVVPVFNIYETNDPLHGAPRDAPNVENWDASDERAPERGEDGGAALPVKHTTIDNSAPVRDRVVAEVLERVAQGER